MTSGDLTDFIKWPGNPLIPTHAEGYTAHYRDPQVFRDPDRPGEYRMLIGVQRADETRCRSPVPFPGPGLLGA